MEDRSEVLYLETTMRGVTTDDPADLAALSDVLRDLRAKALTEDVMREAWEKWT